MPITPTDFKFNASQSYSPLLSALAEAPANAAKLSILQEQNRRQRLSDLLTNLSNSALIGRSLQQIHEASIAQKAKEQTAQDLGQQNPMAKSLYLGNEGYSQGLGGILGQFQGLDTAMSPGVPSQPPTTSLQGEGVLQPGQSPSGQGNTPQTSVPLQGEGVQNPNARRALIMNRIMPQGYEPSTNPETGLRELVSKIPGMPIIPIDQQKAGLVTSPEDLNPVQRKSLEEASNKFMEDSKPETDVLLNVKEFQNLAKAKNPISDKAIKILAPKLTGVAARANPSTLEIYGGSDAVLAQIKGGLERAKTGNLTDDDRKFFNSFANTIGLSANDAIKQKLGDAVTRAQSQAIGVHPDLLTKSIGGNLIDRVNNYKPLAGDKPLKITQDVISYARKHKITPQQALQVKQQRMSQ